MGSAIPAVTLPAPVGWSPQTEMTTYFPTMAELRQETQPEIRSIEGRLNREEACGRDTSCLRQVLRELRWRLEYTADAADCLATLERIRTLAALPSPPSAAAPDKDGSYGACTRVWFLKLDASVDRMLAPDFDHRGKPPCFLDRINDPDRLKDYLDSLLLSRLAEDGIDRRKELNFATADLVRLILWRRPTNYPWDPRLETVIRRFVAEWQDPVSGFFGATYLLPGRRFRTVDLSLTFHMARYLEGRIDYWPELIDTLLAIRDDRYPNGWLDEVGMTSHNNYDVAILLQLGWPKMRTDQRQRAEEELGRLLDWCLTGAIASDGEIVARANGESLPESYYFTIAFLDTVGYFDPAKRFWTSRGFPEATAMRARLEDRVIALHQGDPMARMARERLCSSTAAAVQPGYRKRTKRGKEEEEMRLTPEQQDEVAAQRVDTQPTRRATVPAIEEILYEPLPVLDHGFVRVIDYMGDDAAIVQAARVSYGRGTRKVSEDRGLINYLMRHRHTTPFEMCEIKYHVKLPIFVARQWIRHRTANVNEHSARYSILDNEFYLPAPVHLAVQATTNRQGRGAVLDGAAAQRVLDLLRRDAERAYAGYAELLDEDASSAPSDPTRPALARELARINLTLGFYTQWYWKTDLHNLMHFLSLRADPHAQYEIRAYAETMLDTLARWVPMTYAAFVEYRMNAAVISATGLAVIRRLLAGEQVDQASSGLSAREWRELMALLQPAPIR